MSAGTLPDHRTQKSRDPLVSMAGLTAAPPDEAEAAVRAKYARVVAVKVGIRFADDLEGMADVFAALGLTWAP